MVRTSTSRPVYGAWTTARPAPRYIITCPGYCTRSPGWAVSHDREAEAFIWRASWCASPTPTVPQAYIVSPEQSKPLRGDEALRRYGTPTWLSAAYTTVRRASVVFCQLAKSSSGDTPA